MSKFFQEYTLQDIGQGLNRFHSLDSIPEGQMVTLRNVDALSNGQLGTRKGFEQYYGCIPLRAKTFSKVDGLYSIVFDNAATIDLSGAVDGPIVVSATLPADSNPGLLEDFGVTQQVHYYSSYDITLKETFASGTNTTTKVASDLGVTQNRLMVAWYQADSAADLSNTVLVPEEIRITKATSEIQFDHVLITETEGYFGYLEVPDAAGSVYSTAVTSQTTVTINQAIHNLTNNDFIIRCYADDGTTFTDTVPSEITSTAGNITITFGSAFTGTIVVAAASEIATKTAITGPQTLTVSGITTPFNIFEVWATSGSTKTQVVAGDLVWDATTGSLSVDYTGPSAESVDIVWLVADYVANEITFTGTDGGTDFDTSSAEVTVWGICHEGIYKSSATKGGFTHHLDNYRSETNNFMVTALGGNLYSAGSFGDHSDLYKMASLTLRGSNQVSVDTVLAPLFSTLTPGYTRARGNIEDASVSTDGYASITDITSATSEEITVTLAWTTKSSVITLGTHVSTSDYLTIKDAANGVNNGSFRIKSIDSDSATETVITLENMDAIVGVASETGSGAQCNVFTDQLVFTSNSVFTAGDLVNSDSFTGYTIKSIDTSDATKVILDGITSNIEAPDGVTLYVNRSSKVIPLQNFPSESVGDDTDGGFVSGDSLTIGGVNNNPKVSYINANASNASVAITVASDVGTVTLAGHELTAGQTILFNYSDSAGLHGEYVIQAITATTTFTITTSNVADGSYTANMIGNTIEIDESLPIITGPTTVTVANQGRWIPVENPKSSASKILDTKVTHWDESSFTNQPYLRSVIVNDSMFLTNQLDEVKKFDGSNITNSGLVPFQGMAFLTVDTTVGALSQGSSVGWDNASSNPAADGYFVIDSTLISLGERFKSGTSSIIYRAKKITPTDSLQYRVYVDQTIDAVDNAITGTLTLADTYRYYVRYNQLDVNRNIVASAMLGAEDLYAEVFSSSSIQLKILGMPAFAELDHSRIEVEVYRTKKNTAGPFYRVHRELVDYGDNGGYVVILDSKVDEVLGVAQLDIAVPGATGLGNTWANPPIASAMTTVDNRLVLANIKSPPTLDITFNPVSTAVVGDFDGGQIQFQKSTATTSAETSNDTLVFSFENSATTLTPATDIIVAPITSHTWVDGDETANVITETSHGLGTGTVVQVSNSGGALPTELAGDTNYYIINLSANTYSLATTLANATAGTAIVLTSAGGGTHTTAILDPHVVITDSTLAAASAGDWTYLFHSALGEDNDLDFAGWYRLSEVDTTRVIIYLNTNRSVGAAATTDVDRFVLSSSSSFTSGLRVPVWIGTDGNMGQIFENIATIDTRVSSRLGMAINSVMATENAGNTHWASSRPEAWLMAQSGQSYPQGTLKVNMVDDPSGSLRVQWVDIGTNINTFINNTMLSANTNAVSETRLFNSRLSISYPNFSEIMDDPFGDSQITAGVIDINPADGQEIVAVLPFFGQSVFGSANLSQAVVVLKTSSVYLADVRTGQYQRINSNGQGCTAPRSPALIQDGLLWANESGIYKIGWDMKVSWAGRLIRDLWRTDLQIDNIAEFCGHNHKQERKYKLGVTPSGQSANTEAVVYDHTRDRSVDNATAVLGSWSLYSNHAATGWANKRQESFFGNQSGQILRIRNTGGLSDYRDDSSPIADQEIVTGALGFGLPGNRKTIAGVTIQYQNPSAVTGLIVSMEQSLSGTFEVSDTVNLSADKDNQTIRYALPTRKGTFLRLKLQKSGTIDQAFFLSKITFSLKDIGTGAVRESSEV